MEGKARPPRRGDMVEVRLRERGGCPSRACVCEPIEPQATRDVRPQMRRVAYRVAQHRRVEIDKDHALARHEEMLGLQVAVDRRLRDIREAPLEGGDDSLDRRS